MTPRLPMRSKSITIVMLESGLRLSPHSRYAGLDQGAFAKHSTPVFSPSPSA